MNLIIIGGTLGLFCGMSFLSIFEIIYWLFMTAKKRIFAQMKTFKSKETRCKKTATGGFVKKTSDG